MVKDQAVHNWYRFVLSFPPHLVVHYIQRFGLNPSHRVLDPFCGTGTTLVECKKCGIPAMGIEAHPMSHFATSVKIDWSPNPDRLIGHAERIGETVFGKLKAQGLRETYAPYLCEERAPYGRQPILKTLNHEESRLLLTNSISPLPLHKSILLRDVINEEKGRRYHRHELLAFAKTIVESASNLHFGPEVGVQEIKTDAPVIQPWLDAVMAMSEDLRCLKGVENTECTVHRGDARDPASLLSRSSVDAVITSPPYPNEKDYTRTTRLESVLLGFVRTKQEMRALKRTLVRSNTRGVYKADDDDQLVASNTEINRIAADIEKRRIEMGKTSGFERLYARVAKLYFGGMARHLAELRCVLRPGAQLAYVVGDQASYLRVMIRTGQILADIADSLGYQVVSIDLFRTRLATATREQLREEVVVLRWPGATTRNGPFRKGHNDIQSIRSNC